MSKIKISEIESSASNTDLQITPNGTGVFEVAGDGDDGILQLNSASQTNNVKIKSPNEAAGQSYTMILPENDITADKFLQVGTVTGSGANAVGQLQLATVTPQSDQLNASNLTSGSLPVDRVGDLPASSGFGLKLISRAKVTEENSIDAITFSNLDDGGMYKIIFKNLIISPSAAKRADWTTYYSGGVSGHNLFCYFLDSNGQPDSGIHTAYTNESYGWQYMDFSGSSNSSYFQYGRTDNSANNVSGTNIYIIDHYFTGEMELYSKVQYGYARCKGWSSLDEIISIGGFNDTSKRIYGVTFVPGTTAGFFFGKNTEILLFKYVES